MSTTQSTTLSQLHDVGCVKRDDINLRLKYYGLKTKIYAIAPYHYVIQILNYHEIFEEIKNDFDKNICRIGSWVELVKEKPVEILEEVEPLNNIAYNNEGIFLTHMMLESLLISRFPNVNFISSKVEHNNGIVQKIIVDEKTKLSDMDEIKQFILQMKLGYTDVVVERAETEAKRLYYNEVDIACTDNRFQFSVDDSEFWFENVEKIYSGQVTTGDLRFFDKNKTKCYLDFSVWENRNINIRSNVLLYDTVYISFPLDINYDEFLRQQKLTLEDLRELVDREKLVILLPNTELRYNSRVIEELYQINHNCIVSKRGINTLMATYYCDLERQYMSYWKGNEAVLESICMECMKSKDEMVRMLPNILLWPIKAKVQSFELLTSYSPLKLPSIGANTLFDMHIKNMEHNDDIQFELVMNSNSIHIASALHATYFPFYTGETNSQYTDAGVADVLGKVLNSYLYHGTCNKNDLMLYEDVLKKERNAIYLLRSENSVSMKNILDYQEKYKTTQTQRNAAYKPSIVFNPVTVSFKWNEFGNWLNIDNSTNVDIEIQDETLVANVKMKIHCLLKAFTKFNIVNIGVGTAKNVVFSWSEDNLVRLQQYMDKHSMEKEKILTIGTESDVYTTNGSLVTMNKIGKNVLMLVLPNKENEYSLEIPPQYTIIINEAIRRNHLNEKVNPFLDLRIKYQDIQGITYSEVILVLIKRIMYELNEDGSGRAMYQLIPALPSEVVD